MSSSGRKGNGRIMVLFWFIICDGGDVFFVHVMMTWREWEWECECWEVHFMWWLMNDIYSNEDDEK